MRCGSGVTSRRGLLLSVVASALCFASPARAPHVPDHRIRIVVPFPPGGATDTIARSVSQKISEALKVPTSVENRPGGGGVVAVNLVREAPPDGSVLLFTPSFPMTLLPVASSAAQYNPSEDFAPVAQVAKSDFAIATSASSEFRTIGDLVAAAKARPGTVTYAFPGIGTFSHIIGLSLSRIAGADFQAVPYRGTAPALADAAAGNISFVISPLGELISQQQSGRLRILAKSGLERSPVLPDLPTLREVGFGIEGSDWYGIFAPAKTDPNIVGRINAAVVNAVQMPDVRQLFASIGIQPTGTTPAQLGQIQRADAQLWQSAFAAAGLKAQSN
jgi:tripartite-type tricarboxylate transporter receptor subunit TctC